jgi:hypothetical protein
LSGRGRIKKRNHRGAEGAEIIKDFLCHPDESRDLPIRAGFHHEDTKFTKLTRRRLLKRLRAFLRELRVFVVKKNFFVPPGVTGRSRLSPG